MKRFSIILILTACLFGMAAPETLAKVSFRTIPRQNVVAGQNFNITFRLSAEDEDVSGVSLPTPPAIPGCKLLSGPNVTTSMSTTIINGKRSSQEIYDLVCIYRAENKGKVTVPSVSINVKGATLRTEEISFEILPPDQSATAASVPGQPAAANPGNASAPSGKDFFVRVIFSKSNLYEQEGVVAVTKLYRPNDRKFSLQLEAVPSMPVYEGFLSEELKANPEAQVENYNGKNYITYELARVLLFPQKSGTLKVTSGRYTLNIQEQTGYIRMHAFATPRYEEYSYTTPLTTATLNVKALPQPQPADFCGAVGNYTISSSLEPDQLRTNESATYSLTFKGTGNVKYLTMPSVNFPPTFDKYTARSDIKASVSGQTYTGSYTAEFPIVPQEQGTFEIPAQTFSYFDLSSQKYVQLTTQPYTCRVERGSAVATTVEQKKIDTEMQDIRHIRVAGSASRGASDPVFFRWWYWGLWGAVLLILLGSAFAYRKQLKLAADVVGRRNARANRVASKRFRAAASFMKSGKSEAFYEELARALKGYVGDKLGMQPSQLISDTIADRLREYGVPDATITTVIDVLNECEMARFTPSQSQSAMNELYNRASGAIKEIEDIKMKSRKGVATALMILLCASAAFASSEAQLGDSAYNKENFREAIIHYQKSLADDGADSRVYYNLGNACYRSGETAQAVLAYERSLRLDPSDADAKANLNFVNQRLEDKPEDNNSILSRGHNAIVNAFPADTWAWIAFVSFVLICVAAATYIFSSNVNARKAGFFGGGVLAVLTLYFAVVAYSAANRLTDHSEAIVTAPSTLLNSVPRMPRETEKIVPLHEGTKVEILDSVATPDDPVSPRWYRVRINGSADAWLRATDVERI